MTLKPHAMNLLCTALVVVLLAGCASGGGRAPVMNSNAAGKSAAAQDHRLVREAVSHDVDWRPQTYTVQKGDTLFGIALNYGFDYHELAELNGIQNPNLIQAGQEIRLFPAGGTALAVKPAPPETVPVPEDKPVVTEIKPVEIAVIDQPMAIKLPYSEAAVAQIAKMQQDVQNPLPLVTAKAITAPVPLPSIEPKPAPQPVVAAVAAEGGDDAIAWAMPASGKVIADFSESDNRKGIDLAGKLGQPVLASAAGKVVYSGSGLRGYGKLVIIKHNQIYLSAYAHNDQLLVKEGQTVTQGQKIAEMGNTDADRVMLHFEIRKLGKPVDPAKFLPLVKS